MAIKFKNALTYGYGFNITAKGPVDSRTVVDSIADLTSVWGSDAPAYVGMVVAVVEDGNLYTLTADDATNIDNWKQVGSGAGSITVENFTFTEGDDPKIVEADKIGQIIYVTGGTEDYPAGPYIVTGVGTVSSLTTVPAGETDLGSAVATLQGKVGTLETDVDELKTNVVNVYNKTESDERYVAKEGYVAFTQEEKDKLSQITPDSLALKTDLDPINQNIASIKAEIGAPAEGETAASGIYGVIADVESRLKSDITAIPKFAIKVVDALPTEGISDTTVYLVKDKESEGDLYTEYIHVDGAWENLGKQTVDLSGYSTTEQMNSAIESAVAAAIAGVYSKSEVDGLLSAKVDGTSFDVYKQEVTNALAAKVAISDLDTYKQEVTDALAAKVAISDLDTYKQEVTDALAGKVDNATLNDYQTTKAAEAAHNELAGRLDIVEGKASANETAIANLKVKDVDNTPASGIAVELTEEGKVKASVNRSTLAADLVGTAGVVGDLSGANVKIGTAITATEEVKGEVVTKTIIDSTVTVAEAVQVLAGQIQSAVAGGITGISGDEYIKVSGNATSKSITLEVAKVVTAVSNSLVGENSAIQKDENDHLQLVWSSL